MVTKTILKDFTKANVANMPPEYQLLRLAYDLQAERELYSKSNSNCPPDHVPDALTSQAKISELLEKRYKIKVSQPTISRILAKMKDTIYVFGRNSYSIYFEHGMYNLSCKDSLTDSIISPLVKLSPFTQNTVLKLTPAVIAYKVCPDKKKQFVDLLFQAYGKDIFFDIISHKNRLYLILNKNAPAYTSIAEELKNLPSLVEKSASKNRKTITIK